MSHRRWKFLFFAIAAVGLLITVSAFVYEPPAKTYVLEGDGSRFVAPKKTFAEKLVDWAHHFGPELLILAIAAGVIDNRLERERQRVDEERRKSLARQRLVERLRLLLRYLEDNNAFFTGDSIVTLENERKRLQESATGAKEIRGDDEQRLLNGAIEYANQFLGAAQPYSFEADKWFMAGVQLRLQLLKSTNATAHQIADG